MKNECIICLEKIEDEEYQLVCSHIFHKECINKWQNKNPSCPICRFPIEGKGNKLIQYYNFEIYPYEYDLFIERSFNLLINESTGRIIYPEIHCLFSSIFIILYLYLCLLFLKNS